MSGKCFVGLGALLGVMSGAEAQPAPLQPSSTSAEAPVRADAMELAHVLNPEQAVTEMVVQSFVDAMRAEIGASADYKQLEMEYPGISQELIDATSAATRSYIIAGLPALRRRYARFYASHFSVEEIAELTHFYSSKSGQRLVELKFARLSAGFKASGTELQGERQISEQQVRDINRSTSTLIGEELSAEDTAALTEFAKRPVFAKLSAKRTALEQLEAEIANEPDPKLDAAIDAASRKVMEKFLGGTFKEQ